jgi:hypothetical protein
MTPESDLLVAAFGVLLALGARARNDQMLFGGEWHAPPVWIRRLVRKGPGPIAVMAVGAVVWGFGFGILGVLAAFQQARAETPPPLLPLWLYGGVVVLTILDFAAIAISKMARRRR